MTNETSLTEASGYERRWKVWVAKGVEHDRTLHSRTVGVAVVAIIGLVLWLVGLVALG